MSCKSCSTGGCGSVKVKDKDAKVSGCNNNGACGTGGCNKMNVFDWLSNMEIPQTMRYNIVEVKFKGGRKEYFRNANKLELFTGDFVAVEMPTGYHVGSVSLQGELVRLQMVKKGVKENEEIKNIIRKASDKDLEKHEQAIARDLPTMYRTREIVKDLKLQMKLSDVEYQSDNTKATFYYSAEDRVDFRELIKLLAGEFKIRVEMKQISLRQEAARIGGIGSCGRELCCSTWLTDFRNIPTSAARYQSLSLNPTKLSGQCGRLKCCLNYELETYMDALSDIPQVEKSLKTVKGDAVLQKTDIFRKIMWFSYNNDANWISIPMNQVIEIQQLNEKNIIPSSLEDLQTADEQAIEKSAPINQDLQRLDKKYSSGGRFSDNRKGKDKAQNFKSNPENRQKNRPAEPKPQGNQAKPIQNKENRPPQQGKDNRPTQAKDNRPPQQMKENRPPQQVNENRPPQQVKENRPPQQPKENRPPQADNSTAQPNRPTPIANTNPNPSATAGENRPQNKNKFHKKHKNRGNNPNNPNAANNPNNSNKA